MKKNEMSFTLGKNNPKGLKLDINYENGEAWLNFVPDETLSGWDKIVHGGIISTVLDEVMAWSVISTGKNVVTAEMNIRFLKPMKIDKEYSAYGKIKDVKKIIYETEGIIKDKSGVVFAKANARFFLVKEGKND
ncbi:MAG TPA: PaaI family thioesterase [Tepiditoga sp.]|nr:PaaI family thioesterase [Thermotogota bacterium]HOO73719.1 PaaI family thioesterase [Tepiditoga sp.]